jgi:peptidoglycan/LPS O-acetylase OafA/YrhL
LARLRIAYNDVMISRENSTNLDALRSIAVLLVFLSHLLITLGIPTVMGLPLAEFGRSGVLLFFVHTSLVLMMSMQRMRLSRPWPDFGVFYVRRFFRIYPLSIFCIAVMVSFRIPAEPDAPFHPAGIGGILSNLTLFMNVTEHPPILGPLWSLPYEVQMYLVLPVLYLVVRRYQSAGRLLAIAALWAVTALAERMLMGRSFVLQFGPCFIAGVTAYQYILKQRKEPSLPSFTWPVAVVAVASFYVFSVKASHIASDVPVGWVICLLLGWMIPQWREIQFAPFGHAVKNIAKYSYGIYLFHNPAIWVSFVLLKGQSPVLQWSVLTALMVAIPVAVFHAIESPLIEVGKRFSKLLTSRPVEQSAAASQSA